MNQPDPMNQPYRHPSLAALRTCPLCGRNFPHWRLHKHIHSEPRRLRDETIVEIRKDQPDWVEQGGACERCWESYRGVVCVARFMDHLRLPKHWGRHLKVAIPET